ncbi:MAG: DNA helicase UvrD [Mesorhizobium sp.]|uniref:UvrD-helicase domain-containing protein n=1 Tax=Mesorhizobium sp. TaxID=1871066 RepID=UPI000FEA00DF|nr:UvrD-helicase domain-containing protein [Mesorhizobium sp.]RWH52858.1 MAG: DNA helicase UvrD [Mesorhizobium sp.]
MTEPSDAPARARALSDFGSTLLVEAAAGTGKTSLLAGRIALLLASGAPPASIAAITFTRLAADELAGRVREMIDELLARKIPRPLRAILPDGLTDDQRRAVEAAAVGFDGLTITTIHGFCQEILRRYAVEADIDPGAEVLDRDGEELAFGQVFEAWLGRRLGERGRADDPIAVLARRDPRKSTKTLRKMADFRREHRDAKAPVADLTGRPDLAFTDAVSTFRRAVATAPPDNRNAVVLENLEELDCHFRDGFAAIPDFARLWQLAHPPQLSCMAKDSFDLQRPRHLRAPGPTAAAAHVPLVEAYEAADAAYRRLMGRISSGVFATLFPELDEVLSDYEAYKRRAALLDFDDLLVRARRLLRTHESVRQALAARYRRLLVDEFQDTDPGQCDIIFRIAADEPAEDWTELSPRAGALFLVGDPKQAIFQFRGAHISTYESAKAVIARTWPDNILQITANFRSREGVLAYVNGTFRAALNAVSQPGYVDLEATRGDDPARPSATRLTIAAPPDSKREALQIEEADAVAAVCAKLMGTRLLRDAEGRIRPVAARDIALLAPTSNSLWLFERALRRAGLPIASQAGKGLYRRQESQDVIALVRVLADAKDTAAFGALMRGPLVGFTDQALLDITAALPARDGRPGVFTVTTPLDDISDPEARAVVSDLVALRRRARFTSPAQLLGEAIERLGVRIAVSLRDDPRHAAAATANIDVILERAARYGVRGLRRLAADLHGDWRDNREAHEGWGEVDGDAVSIVTMHSAKGLEWPIVIPINGMVQLRSPERFVRHPDHGTLHWLVGDIAAPELAEAVRQDAESQLREKVRLWYVACTRARDFLILPHHPSVNARSWARVLELGAAGLPEIDLRTFGGKLTAPDDPPPNGQDAATFAEEAARIAAASPPIAWLRPSDHDADRAQVVEVVSDSLDDEDEAWIATGGRLRGLVLHKLMEEILEEGLAEEAGALAGRARELTAQLLAPGETDGSLDDVAELAQSVLRTLALPDVMDLRPRLRAELPIYALVGTDDETQPMAGRADAVAYGEDGAFEVVVDWKSDIAPGPRQLADHVDQLRLYLAATGAPRGALVYMSLGRVRWVEPAT